MKRVADLTASSLSFAMASINGLGGKPHFSADLTIIMNRMVTPLLCVFLFFHSRAAFPNGLNRECDSGSTGTSNSRPLNRQRPGVKFSDASPAASNSDGLRFCGWLGGGGRLV